MAKIVNFLLYKLYFKKKKSPYLSSSCFTPPHPKPHWIQFTQHPVSLLTLLPCFYLGLSLSPRLKKKSYPRFRICSKFVMIPFPITTVITLQNFILWKWVAIGKP